MEKITKRAELALRLTQQQENALNQIIALQVTMIQLAGINRIPPNIIQEEMKKRGLI